ncbi:MAG: PRC-barrel domain-containing protein [Myxococcales bacterium]|nr:PRC-barrel domain-containing protein [Myxococcales bacterium]
MTETSDLRGVLVVAQEEGVQLGTVTGINIDTFERRIAAIRFRPRGINKKEGYVLTRDVRLVGQDVIFVATQKAAKNEDTETIPGRSLHALQGARVTTIKGKLLGTLVDVDFTREDWKLNQLRLAGDMVIPVVPTEISIEDEIVVPASYEDHMQRLPEATGHNGLLARVFGKENVEHLSQSLKRAWGRHDEPVKKDEPKKAVPKKETPEK